METRQAEEFLKQPTRGAIIRIIGEREEISLTEMRSKMTLSVGTLYYHLDRLSGLVTQNTRRRYILTDEGKKAYDYMKRLDLPPLPVKGPRPRVSSVAREILLLETYSGMLGTDPRSNLGLLFGVLVLGVLLSAIQRIGPNMLLLITPAADPFFAAFKFLASWLILFAIATALGTLIWGGQRNVIGVASATSFAFIPTILAMLIEGLGSGFGVREVNILFEFPYVLVFQAVVGLWSSYLFTFSLRSAIGLPLEKVLVITLFVLFINCEYLWLAGILPH